MIPWEFLESAPVPGSGGELCLYRRGEEFSIRVGNRELMNSRAHASEEALAELACARVAGRPRPRILIGGLGMGFTLAAALRRLGPDGRVVVAELVPAVVAWNRGPLAPLAGHPLQDARVTVREVDVAQILRVDRQAFDADSAGCGQRSRGAGPSGERLALRSAWAGGGPRGPSPGRSAGRLVFRTPSGVCPAPAPGGVHSGRGPGAGA